MRVVAVLVVLMVALGLVALIVHAVRRGTHQANTRLLREAQWRFRHFSQRSDTVVAVSLVTADDQVLENREIDRFSSADPEWVGKFLRARLAAEERALYLNAGGSLPQTPPPSAS